MISFVLNFTVILFLSAQQNEVYQVAVGHGEEIYSEVLKQSIILFLLKTSLLSDTCIFGVAGNCLKAVFLFLHFHLRRYACEGTFGGMRVCLFPEIGSDILK